MVEAAADLSANDCLFGFVRPLSDTNHNRFVCRPSTPLTATDSHRGCLTQATTCVTSVFVLFSSRLSSMFARNREGSGLPEGYMQTLQFRMFDLSFVVSPPRRLSADGAFKVATLHFTAFTAART